MIKESDKNNKKSLAEYKEALQQTLPVRNVTFLLKGDEVLLGLKQRGFGEGKLMGIGGKVDDSDRTSPDQDRLEVIKNGASREILEEIGVSVDPKDLQARGSMKYYFPHKNGSWDFECYAFVTDKWEGEPKGVLDSNGVVEIDPLWVKINEIPFDKMWDDAQYWLSQVLTGESVSGEFLFGEDLNVTDKLVKVRSSS